MDEKEEKTWSMLMHLSALAGLIVPFGNVVGPLIVWLIKKEESSLVDEHGKESLNFQISVTIYGVILTVIGLVLSVILIGFLFLLLLVPLMLFGLGMAVFAGIKANEGEKYRYPLTIRLIK